MHTSGSIIPRLNKLFCHVHEIGVLAFQGVALHAAGLLRGMVELEARRVLDIVVPSVSEGVVGADNDSLAASG